MRSTPKRKQDVVVIIATVRYGKRDERREKREERREKREERRVNLATSPVSDWTIHLPTPIALARVARPVNSSVAGSTFTAVNRGHDADCVNKD